MNPEENQRESLILDAAADLIIQHGFNKVTMTDIADVIGLSRGLVYLHFKNKEDVLEALIIREMQNYGDSWIQHIEADEEGGTIASIYRAILYALNATPLMAAIVKRDEQSFGKYLRKQGNIFENLQAQSQSEVLLEAMQEAGVIRAEVNCKAIGFIMDAVSARLVSLDETSQPNFDEVMESFANLLDSIQSPLETNQREAGKAVLRQFAEQSRSYFASLREKISR